MEWKPMVPHPWTWHNQSVVQVVVFFSKSPPPWYSTCTNIAEVSRANNHNEAYFPASHASPVWYSLDAPLLYSTRTDAFRVISTGVLLRVQPSSKKNLDPG